MELIKVKLTEVSESSVNPRGKDFHKETGFEDLVASIKEKGVLTPILIRKKGQGFEVIAGNRRTRAAKLAGLEEVPAQLVKMDDVEAREAQIVENLQRSDIHPLDEGESYRQLIEKSKPRYEAKDVAKKVGKSETYVRSRLALTNLTEKAAKAFREGDMTITHAILISRLDSDKQQNDATKEVVQYGMSTERLSEWIRERVYIDLSKKPWAGDAKLSEMVGDFSKKPSLFGDKAAGEDPAEYARQMSAFIEIKMREATEKGEKLVKVSTHWGTPEYKGALGHDQYRILHSKEDIKKATEKDAKGIVVEGDDLGQIFRISTATEDLREGGSVYKLTPEEKDKRKKERVADEKKKEKADKDLLEGIAKVKWPMKDKHLDVLLDLIFGRFGFSYIQPVAKRHGIKAEKKTEGGWTHRDLETPLRKWVNEQGNNGKIQFIFEVALESAYSNKEQILKKL